MEQLNDRNIPSEAVPEPGPGRIFLLGFMGCGKTHWGRQLAPALDLPFIDLDQKIEEQAGKPINAIFHEEGEEYFRQLEKEILYLLTESHDRFVMATGGGTPCFYKNIDYLKEKGLTVWINCSLDCLYQRLLNDSEHRPLVRDLGEDQLRAYIHRKHGDRKIYYRQAHILLEQDDLQLETLMERIRQGE